MLLVQALDKICNVDLDSLDPAVAKSVGAALGKLPTDQTSNPIIVKWAMENPAYKEDLLDSIKARLDQGWEAVHDHFVVKLCHRNSVNISGRVLVQLSARHVDSYDKVLAQGRNVAAEFEKLGMNRDSFVCKIPITGPAVNACKTLNAEGIRTLGTTIYSVVQGVAASQANCLYISPYYNESMAHVDPDNYWPNVKDPALEHPMSPRVIQISEIYKSLYKSTGKPQPLIKLAGFVSYTEAIGAAEIGAHSVTITPKVLDQLCTIEATEPLHGHPKQLDFYATAQPLSERLAKAATTDPLTPNYKYNLPSTDVDYLADNGKLLEEALAKDSVAPSRMSFSLDRFAQADLVCKEIIEKLAKEASA